MWSRCRSLLGPGSAEGPMWLLHRWMKFHGITVNCKIKDKNILARFMMRCILCSTTLLIPYRSSLFLGVRAWNCWDVCTGEGSSEAEQITTGFSKLLLEGWLYLEMSAWCCLFYDALFLILWSLSVPRAVPCGLWGNNCFFIDLQGKLPPRSRT